MCFRSSAIKCIWDCVARPVLLGLPSSWCPWFYGPDLTLIRIRLGHKVKKYHCHFFWHIHLTHAGLCLRFIYQKISSLFFSMMEASVISTKIFCFKMFFPPHIFFILYSILSSTELKKKNQVKRSNTIKWATFKNFNIQIYYMPYLAGNFGYQETRLRRNKKETKQWR